MIVVADSSGRLGNQLLVYSHTAALAAELGTSFHHVAFYEAADLFEGTNGSATARFPRRSPRHISLPQAFRRAVFIAVKVCIGVAWRMGLRKNRLWRLIRSPWGTRLDLGDEAFLREARRTRVTTLQGWGLRSERLLQRHAEEVCRHLRPLPVIENKVRSTVAAATDDADMLVGVHVRRRDYAEWCGGRFFFGARDYRRVIDQVASLFPGKRVRYLVTSDDLGEASLLEGDDVTVCRGSAIEDLFSLAACDYLVGPPSTFTYWASFYGDVPLYPILDPDNIIASQDFAVAPDFVDPCVNEFFWADL